MSMRIEGDEGDTAFRLMQSTLAPFGMPAPPDREGPLVGKDLSTLRQRLATAGFTGGTVAWKTYATLPVHDKVSYLEFAKSQPGTKKFLSTLEPIKREEAEQALAAAAADVLSKGAIQIAVAVVVARC